MAKLKNNKLSDLLEELKSIQAKIDNDATAIDETQDLIKRAGEIKSTCETILIDLESFIQSNLDKEN